MKWTRKHGAWHCLNPYGEDTVISRFDGLVNDSPNQGRWAVSHGGKMVESRGKIRTFKTMKAAKAVAERLVRKFKREIVGPDNQCFECGSRIVRGKCAYCEKERKE